MKTISKKVFERWINGLGDSNPRLLLKWFGDGKTFNECWKCLREDWSEDEVASAFMA